VTGPFAEPGASIAVVLTFTDRASEAVALFHRAAARWDPNAQIRLERDGVTLAPKLAAGPEPGDVTLDVGGVTVFVPGGLDGVVDAGDHNELTVAPS
jgi:hypothetical protein